MKTILFSKVLKQGPLLLEKGKNRSLLMWVLLWIKIGTYYTLPSTLIFPNMCENYT